MHSAAEKLEMLRSSMKENGLDAYIISDTDPHLNENKPAYWNVLAWLTGFTGSAGTVVITQCFAGLWTDSRYFIQAETQLSDSGIELMKTGAAGNSYTEWLPVNIENGSRIGFD